MSSASRPAGRRAGLVSALLACAALVVGTAKAADQPTSSAQPGAAKAEASAPAPSAAQSGGPVEMRRLTQEQYKQIIADIFGPTVKLGGRFEPDVREGGLIAIGAGQISVTASGFEQYDTLARSIAMQVVDEQHRGLLIPCKPASATAPDDGCTKQFLSKAGRLLYRRPLTDHELQAQVSAAGEAAKKVKNFYTGLALSLAAMLESPQFLFRQEVVEPDPDHAGQYRLNAYSKASRLSFLLWNAGPDPELLAAAESGELNTEKGLDKQVDRLLASPRLEAGVRAFFSDMLGFETFDTLAKDPMLYPKFTFKVAGDAQEQTLRTLVDLLVTNNGDYRDIFTTRKTFMTAALASIYKVPLVVPDGLPNAWVAYEYPEDAPQAGILTEASFVALHSHPGRSSPTLRGKALRETLLCQRVPDPPGNVNFNLVQDTSNPNYKTVRQRLTAHATDAMCTGCHKLIDPAGLAMENYDTIGGFRLTENGAPIDASGELDGTKFTDVKGLAKALHDHPQVPACLVTRVYSYAVGRKATKAETDWLKNDLQKQFATDGYKLPALLRRVATSEAFYRVAAPDSRAGDVPASKLASDTSAR